MPSRAERLDDVAHRVDAGAVAFDARQMALRRPAAVAVHDDGDVRRQLLEVDLARQRLVGRSRRNPRQELLKRHAGSFAVNRDYTSFGQPQAIVVIDATRNSPAAGAVGPGRARDRATASTSAIHSGGRRPRPTSTSVPTMRADHVAEKAVARRSRR